MNSRPRMIMTTIVLLRERQGAVIVEFALAFPILLVTFVFVCQILNVFNYTILGSYAAFAASRSYSVYRNAGWDEGGFDLENQQINAARQAYGIAVAIMATYTLPSASNDRMPDHWDARQELGLPDDFWRMADTLSVRSSDRVYFAAHARMREDFRIVEFGNEAPVEIKLVLNAGGADFVVIDAGSETAQFTIPMKGGYAYPDTAEVELSGYNWFGTVLDWLGFVPDIPAGNATFFGLPLTQPEPVGHPIKVARISFVYRYPTILASLAGTYLSPGSMGSRDMTFPVYQACAAPIEPVPDGPMEMANARIDIPDSDEVDEDLEETHRLEGEVNRALDQLHDCTEYIRRIIQNDRFDRTSWASDPPWSVATPDQPRPGVIRINPNEHAALSYPAVDALDEAYLNERENPVRNAVLGWSRGNEALWLFDPRASLDDDSAYRSAVMVWIEQEREALRKEINVKEGQINKLNNLIKSENEKDNPSGSRIRRWKAEIKQLNDEIKELNGELGVWNTRYGEEQATRTANNNARQDCLALRLRAVRERLTAYYAHVADAMGEQSGFIDQYLEIMP